MTRITRPLRRTRPVKKIDIQMIRAAVADTRRWVSIGVVIDPEDGAAHYVVENRKGADVDVLIEVEVFPGRIPVTCRLPEGMWSIPNIGDEVIVVFPSGALDFMPVAVCVLSHALPTAQGPQPQRTVIVRGEVLIHDGTGGAVPLALKSDVDALTDKVNEAITKHNTHVHPGVTTGAGSSLVTTSIVADPATAPVGTTVLKSK